MFTAADSRECSINAQRHRWNIRSLLRVAEHLATNEDMALVERIMAASPTDLDKMIGTKEVNSLYLRGVIYFGEQHG